MAFRELYEPLPRMSGPTSFHHTWLLPAAPQVADRVLVPRGDREAWAVVVGVDDPAAEQPLYLQSVTRLATPAEFTGQGGEELSP